METLHHILEKQRQDGERGDSIADQNPVVWYDWKRKDTKKEQ